MMGTARSPLTLIVTTAILVVALCDHTYAYIPAISYPSVPDGWTFLGAGPPARNNLLGYNFNESVYFTAKLPHTWMEAYKLCNATFGLDAWPVNIESEDELAHIMYLIEERVDDDEFTTFWTGAKFDTGSNKFVWDGKEPLESFVPWTTDEPSQSLPTSRLVMKKTAEDPNTWEMFATDEGSKFGFICEVAPRNQTDPPPCDQPNDLIILLENSDRVGNETFIKVLEDIVLHTVAAWKGWSYTRVAFIVNYSNGAGSTCDTPLKFPLDNTLGDFQMAKVITETEFKALPTSQSYCAFQAAAKEFNDHSTRGTTSILFLTSGSYANRDEVKKEAEKLRTGSTQSRIFAMAITKNVPMEDLEDVTKNSDYASTTMDFAWLKDKLEPENKPIC